MNKTGFGKPLPMLLLIFPFLCLLYWSPFGEPIQTALEVIYLVTILAITIVVARRNRDEVEVSAARLSVSVGAYTGIICTVILLVVMVNFPQVATAIARFVSEAANTLPPAAAGFGLGALTAILFMFACTVATYVIWYWRVTR